MVVCAIILLGICQVVVGHCHRKSAPSLLFKMSYQNASHKRFALNHKVTVSALSQRRLGVPAAPSETKL